MIFIQKEKFSIHESIQNIKTKSNDIGALVTFVGYVRDFKDESRKSLDHLYIEYYEAMTKKAIEEIDKEAHRRWELISTNIIHRVGIIPLNDPIVLIAVASKHRDNAFEACRFIIDYLKTEAPLWKKEISENKSSWVEQKESDLVKVK